MTFLLFSILKPIFKTKIKITIEVSNIYPKVSVDEIHRRALYWDEKYQNTAFLDLLFFLMNFVNFYLSYHNQKLKKYKCPYDLFGYVGWFIDEKNVVNR